MGQSRLNGLKNLHIHREIQIKESEILTVLSKKGPEKLKFYIDLVINIIINMKYIII